MLVLVLMLVPVLVLVPVQVPVQVQAAPRAKQDLAATAFISRMNFDAASIFSL